MSRLIDSINEYGKANLARKLGVSPPMITNVVTGKMGFGKANAVKAAKILKIPLIVALGME